MLKSGDASTANPDFCISEASHPLSPSSPNANPSPTKPPVSETPFKPPESDFPPLPSLHEPVLKEHPKFNPWTSSGPALNIPPKAPPKLNLKYKPPVLRGAGRVGVCSAEDVMEDLPILENTAVGFFLGKRPSFVFVRAALLKQWNLLGSVEVILLTHGGFAFRFSCQEDREAILEIGTFYVGGQPIFLRQWTRTLHTGSMGLKHIPLWITLPGLPLHLWSENALSTICSVLGKPLYADGTTASKARLAYARVCIEFSGNTPLEDTIVIEDDEENTFYQQVKYEWRPPHCISCGVFGHDSSTCSMKSAAASEPPIGLVHKPKLGNENLKGTPDPSLAHSDPVNGSPPPAAAGGPRFFGRGPSRVKKMIPSGSDDMDLGFSPDQSDPPTLNHGRELLPRSKPLFPPKTNPNTSLNHFRKVNSKSSIQTLLHSQSGNRFSALLLAEDSEHPTNQILTSSPIGHPIPSPKVSSAGHTPHPRPLTILSRSKNGHTVASVNSDPLFLHKKSSPTSAASGDISIDPENTNPIPIPRSSAVPPNSDILPLPSSSNQFSDPWTDIPDLYPSPEPLTTDFSDCTHLKSQSMSSSSSLLTNPCLNDPVQSPFPLKCHCRVCLGDTNLNPVVQHVDSWEERDSGTVTGLSDQSKQLQSPS